MKSVEFTEAEERALLALIDAGVRHLGLDGANPAAVWFEKIKAAQPADDMPGRGDGKQD